MFLKNWHFKNNWEIIAQKLNQLDLLGALIIRAIILKNNIFFSTINTI